jgi:hypothetical protein
MKFIPGGRTSSTHVKSLLHGCKGAPLGLLILRVIPNQSLELLAQQFADRRGLAGRKLPRLPDQVFVKTECDVLFRHVPTLVFIVFHVKYV